MTDVATDERTADPPADSKAKASRRRPWTLQRRLIVTVVGIVSLILVLVAVAMSAILGSVLEEGVSNRLDAMVSRTATWIHPQLITGLTAAEILEQQPPQPGYLLAIQTSPEAPTGAVTDSDGQVVELTDAQIDELAAGLRGQGPLVVTIEGAGTYRVEGFRVGQ